MLIRIAAVIGLAGTAGGIIGITYHPVSLINKAPFLNYVFLEDTSVGNKYCAQILPGLKITNSDQYSDTNLQPSFFSQDVSEVRERAKGCLTVNWFKNTLSGGGTSGAIQMTWSLIKGDEGFLISEHMHRPAAASHTQFDHEFFWIKKINDRWVVRNYTMILWMLGRDAPSDILPTNPSNEMLNTRMFRTPTNWGFGEVKPQDLLPSLPFYVDDVVLAEGFQSTYEWNESWNNTGDSFGSWSSNLEKRWENSFTEKEAEQKSVLPKEIKEWRGHWTKKKRETYEEYSSKIKYIQNNWGQSRVVS